MVTGANGPQPRKRAPRTNPELAVRRAEKEAPQVRYYEVATPAAVEPAAVRARADDPPAYVDTWNALYALTHGTHEEVVKPDTPAGV